MGFGSIVYDSSGFLFAGVGLVAAATSYWLLRGADAPLGWAVGGALAAVALSYALAFAIVVHLSN